MREHLDLRVKFAAAIAARTGAAIPETLMQYTDFHRLTFGRRPKPQDPLWQEFADKIKDINDPEKALDEAYRFFASLRSYREKLPSTRPYGAFAYGYEPADRCVRLGFSEVNLDTGIRDEPSILSLERRVEVMKNLRLMFADIKANRPGAKIVRGSSWLYNLTSYRSLFPPEYTEKLDDPQGKVESTEHGDFQSMLRWGQFIDRTGAVNQDRKAVFLKGIENLNIDHLADTFPLPTLNVEGDIDKFYEMYLRDDR